MGCSGTGDGVTVVVKFPNGNTNTVKWTYKVTNDSNVDLTNVEVWDDNGTPGSTADDFKIGTIANLAKGGNATLEYTGTAKEGTYNNIARTKAIFNSWAVPEATDPSSYYGVTPKIDVEKYVKIGSGDWQDADTAPGPSVDLGIGQTVQFKFVVTNTTTGPTAATSSSTT